jgi:hypothetical protein
MKINLMQSIHFMMSIQPQNYPTLKLQSLDVINDSTSQFSTPEETPVAKALAR